MSGDAQTTLPPPPVMWAQRKGYVLLTVCLEDCKKPEIDIYNDSVHFKGMGGSSQKEYECTINLYKNIDPKKSNYVVRDRIIELKLIKEESGPFWPQLTQEKKKYHFIKVDFNHWREEDEGDDSDDSAADQLNEYSKEYDKLFDDDDMGNDEWDSDDGDLPALL